MIDELRDARFSELADVEEAQRIDLDGGERLRRRPPRHEVLTILKGLHTKIALQHKGTVNCALRRLNEVLEKGQVTGALIVSRTVEAETALLPKVGPKISELRLLSTRQVSIRNA
ncbi:hypothetical protein L5876_09960 [Hyphobacterium sp. SN044]|uniref:hypothetical protein n=1 Tax=Hyphobacterium sp. SN044 TaxID=2912575 RepID=UPI001F33BE0C|nr:hypothetical protein [Hyphobacterium sp. SN044]MCF8880140.1 hypothetical protein [Hyphobacterium sp. SN044]